MNNALHKFIDADTIAGDPQRERYDRVRSTAGIDHGPNHFLTLHQLASHEWLLNPAVHSAARHAIGILGNQMRKNGENLPQAIHILWTMHQIFNDPVIKNQPDIDPNLAAFVQALHDCLEELREFAEKHKLPLPEDIALGDQIRLWPYEKDHALIRDVLLWMTDEAGLEKSKRIPAQIAKCFDEDWNLRSNVTILHQTVRAYDKLHNALMDSWLIKQGEVTDHAKIVKAYARAREKSYILYFPDISPIIKKRYLEALDILGKAVDKLPEEAPDRDNKFVGPLPPMQACAL